MVLELFSEPTIFNLIDILFKDMAEDYKLLIDPKDEEEGGSDSEHEKADDVNHDQAENHQENEDDEDEDCTVINAYGMDLDDYVGTKGTLNIERIKDIMGEIMNSC